MSFFVHSVRCLCKIKALNFIYKYVYKYILKQRTTQPINALYIYLNKHILVEIKLNILQNYILYSTRI